MLKKIFLIIVLFVFSSNSYCQIEKYQDYFEKLQVDSTMIDTNTVNYNSFWVEVLGVKEKRVIKSVNKIYKVNKNFLDVYKRPDLSPLLNRKLMLGDVEIFEKKSRDANEVIGYAQCQSGKPVITFAAKLSSKICMEAFVFFREHEYAHFKLGHSGCGITSNVFDSHLKELAADLDARNTILNFKDGIRIIDYMISAFTALDYSQDQYLPSSKDRVKNLTSN